LTSGARADRAATIPVAERCGPTTVAFTAPSMAAVVGWVNAVTAMAATLR
jgi:D-amino peptidase